MANLYGRMRDSFTSNRRTITRTGRRQIETKLETWRGSIKTELEADGTFRVYIGNKSSPIELVAEGNVNSDERHYCSGARREERIGRPAFAQGDPISRIP